MIHTDLPDGPADPLVRGLAACLSSVTEVPLAQLPGLENLTVTHALASWKSWLAGHDFGMVPIADPRSFQWAGWWMNSDTVYSAAVYPAGPEPMMITSWMVSTSVRAVAGSVAESPLSSV